jgi:hypothetical protein
MRATKWLQPPTTPASQGVQIEGKPTPTLPADREQEIRAALEASPSKIVLIVMRGHQDNKPGGVHAGDLQKLPDGRKGWDHAAIAFLDKDGKLVFVEKNVGQGLGVVMSQNKSGTVQEVTKYRDVEVVPLDLTRLPEGARERFITTFMEAVARPYSLILKNAGNHCSGAFGAALDAAKSSWPLWAQKAVDIVTMGLRFNPYSPTDAYIEGKKYSVPFRYDPNSPTQGKTIKSDWVNPPPPPGGLSGVKKQPVANSADNNSESLAALAGAALLSPQARASQQPRVDDELKPLLQELKDPSDQARASQQPRVDDDHKPLPQGLLKGPSDDDESDDDALTDHSLQDPKTDADDDEDDLEEEGTLVSDPQDARTRDAPQQREIDDDADDDDDTLMDDADPQPVIDDDDEEPAEEDDEEDELVDASDAEDAPADPPLMQTANAEAGADATADDQAGPQLASSAPAAADDGFSFSAFPKPAAPLEVAKEAMPTDQASPGEESSSSGTPGSEGAHPDADSADVGNAAPSKDPVVHHGDLTP